MTTSRTYVARPGRRLRRPAAVEPERWGLRLFHLAEGQARDAADYADRHQSADADGWFNAAADVADTARYLFGPIDGSPMPAPTAVVPHFPFPPAPVRLLPPPG